MTFERRVLAGIEDIEAIILECNVCRTQVRLSPDKPSVPSTCPSGDHQWVPSPIQGGVSESKFPIQIKLLRAIAGVREKTQSDAIERLDRQVGYRIILEFKEPI